MLDVSGTPFLSKRFVWASYYYMNKIELTLVRFVFILQFGKISIAIPTFKSNMYYILDPILAHA